MIRYLDPKRTRYAAVVVPMAGYKTIPQQTDEGSRTNNLPDIISAFLPLKDAPREIGSFRNSADPKNAALYFELFPEHALASDIQNFLTNPVTRLETVLARYRDGIYWNYDNPGPQGDIGDLKFDVGKQKIVSYPSYFEGFQASGIRQRVCLHRRR